MLTSTSTRLFAGVLVGACLLGGSGCRQDMHDQAKLEPLEASAFFEDGRASRPTLAGTVARGQLNADKVLHTGMGPEGFATEIPLTVNADFVRWGQTRFNIYCSPCHDRAGDGRGMIVERGYPEPTSFHEQRLRDAAPGYFFSAITNGFGVMPSYAMQVPVNDRWAIVAYIKSLQLSRTAQFSDLTEDERKKLEASSDG